MLYHFTLGGPVDDPRLETHPPYQHLAGDPARAPTLPQPAPALKVSRRAIRPSFLPGGEAGRALLALFGVQLFFGVHYALAKELLREIPPEAWAAIRAIGGAVLMTGVTLALGRRLPRSPRLLASLAGLSVLGVAINQYMFVKGLSLTATTHSSLINCTMPVLTLGIAVALRREEADGRKIASLAVALAGVLVLLRVERMSFDLTDDVFRGDLYTLVNAISYSLFLALSGRALRRVDSLSATSLLFLFGSVSLTAIGLPSLLRLDPSALSPKTWLLGAAIIVFPTVGAYLLQVYALRRLEASLVSLFIYLQFVIAGVVAFFALGERPGLRLALAALLVFSGLLLRAGPWVGPSRTPDGRHIRLPP